MSPENAEKLRRVFLDMNKVLYRTESETETVIVTDEYGAIVLDKNGKPTTESKTTLFIYVNVLSMDYRDGADMYQFNADQNEMLTELMQPVYYPLFRSCLAMPWATAEHTAWVRHQSGSSIDRVWRANRFGCQEIHRPQLFQHRLFRLSAGCIP